MQIVSDLHLEFYKDPLDVKLRIAAPYLAMLGDICVAGTNDIKNLETFLDYYAPKYKMVFWLPGNHEFYSGKRGSVMNIEQILKRCKELSAKYPNVVFLNNKHYDISDENGKTYRVIGTTLWTEIADEKIEYVKHNLNDYNHIYTPGRKSVGIITMDANVGLTPEDVNIMNAKASKYIARQLKESPHPVIVLTHHKPFVGGEDVKIKYDVTGGILFARSFNTTKSFNTRL